jgi:hypothetical protein
MANPGEEGRAALERRARVLVETLELSVPFDEDDELSLRIELFEALAPRGHFSARIWRLEYYRIQSTFPQLEGVPAHLPSDEVILKEFEGCQSPLEQPAPFPDSAAARAYVLEQLGRWLTLQLGVAL